MDITTLVEKAKQVALTQIEQAGVLPAKELWTFEPIIKAQVEVKGPLTDYTYTCGLPEKVTAYFYLQNGLQQKREVDPKELLFGYGVVLRPSDGQENVRAVLVHVTEDPAHIGVAPLSVGPNGLFARREPTTREPMVDPKTVATLNLAYHAVLAPLYTQASQNQAIAVNQQMRGVDLSQL